MNSTPIKWDEVGEDLLDLAKTIFKKRAEDLSTDGKRFLQETNERVIKYRLQLAAGEITQTEYDDLMLDVKALAKLEKYKQEGLSQAALDQFVDGAIDILFKAAGLAL
jgi:hypothetical protein